MGFSKQDYWSGIPCPPPGDLFDTGIKPTSPAAPALQADSFRWATGEAPHPPWQSPKPSLDKTCREDRFWRLSPVKLEVLGEHHGFPLIHYNRFPTPWAVGGLVLVRDLLSTGPQCGRWVAGEQAKWSFLSIKLLPLACITAWAPPLGRSAAGLDSHRSTNPTVNCTCEGSRLCAPYENHPKTIHTLLPAPCPWKSCLPWNWILVP